MNTQKIIYPVILMLLIVVLLLIIKQFNIYIPVHITTSNVTSELSVVGEGKVDVVPDTAYVDAGISVVNGSTVSGVQKSIDDINNKILASLQKLGIEKKDITTSNYSINPNYSYDTNRNTITGYNGDANVTIKVTDISKTSQVISEVTAAGANTVNGARFNIEHPENYREEARSKAIANAREQAQKLASSLGIKLGKVTNIVESTDGTVPPIMYGRGGVAQAVMDKSVANIEPGSQTITSTVTLFFEKTN